MILIWKFVSCLDNSRVYLGINATRAVNKGFITVNIYPVVLFARNLQCNGFSPVLIHIWSKSKYPDFPDRVWLWSSETATWKALSFNCLQNNYSIYLKVQRGLMKFTLKANFNCWVACIADSNIMCYQIASAFKTMCNIGISTHHSKHMLFIMLNRNIRVQLKQSQ